MTDLNLLFAFANFALGMTAFFMCLCRLNTMSHEVRYIVRSEYTFYLVAALASALQPLYGEWPRWGSILMLGAMVFGLMVSAKAWVKGPPTSCTHPAPFGGC